MARRFRPSSGLSGAETSASSDRIDELAEGRPGVFFTWEGQAHARPSARWMAYSARSSGENDSY